MKYIFCSLFLIFSATVLFAQTPTKESVEKLLVLRNEPELYKTINAQYKLDIEKWVRDSFKNRKLSPEQQKLVDACVQKSTATFDELAGWEREKEVLINSRLKNYDQKEVDHLIAFYETPESREVVLKSPVIWQEFRDAHRQCVIEADNMIKKSIAQTTRQIDSETKSYSWVHYMVYGLIALGGLVVILGKVKTQYAEDKAWVCLLKLIGYCVVLFSLVEAFIRYFEAWHYRNGNLYVGLFRGGSAWLLVGLLIAALLVRYVIRKIKCDRSY